MAWEILWYLVMGMAMLFYTVLDGFDLGVGSLHLLAKNDLQRRTFLNAIGPVWDGNEVWVVVVIGGMFAGFPNVYSTVLSGFYTLLMFLIAGLMFRAAAIEFRSKRESPGWRNLWDRVFCAASVLVAFALGMMMGNIIEGIPLNSDQDYVGGFADFLKPYPFIVGFMSVSLFALHGAIFLLLKTEGETHQTVRHWVGRVIFFFLFWYAVTTAWTVLYLPRMTARFWEAPYLLLIPLLSLLAVGNIARQMRKGNDGWAFLSSCVSIALFLALFGIGTFPDLVYSTLDPTANTLTIYNSASSPKTLKILLLVVAIGIPFVLAYCGWVYRVFRHKVKLEKTSY